VKYLFIHQNFPGQFLHLVTRLRNDPQHEIIFISEPNENSIEGVRKISYDKPLANLAIAEEAQEFELAARRARTVQGICDWLCGMGFVPDIVIGHHGWGELLNINDVWPGVPLIGYFEFYYHDHGIDVGFDPEFVALPSLFACVRAKNAINHLALTNPGHGQTPTHFQHGTYPVWARPNITVLPEGVDLDATRPDPTVRRKPFEIDGFRVEPTDTLVTYVARDLEPYRGFHTMMRAIPRLQRLRGDLKVVLVGGDNVSYGARLIDETWREYMLKEVGQVIDPARIHFPGQVPYPTFLALLQRSDAHVYLTYPFVLSWSLREALASGCAIVGSNTTPLQEFITHRQNGFLVDFPNVAALVDGVTEVLETPALAKKLRRNARAYAEKHLSMDRYLAAYQALIQTVIASSRR
jgi:glycosyltransferase involved in cell wall biosynthesis